jgi:hypothetical protein
MANDLKVLEQIQKGELTSQEAFDLLYPTRKTKPGKRAHFIKMSIHVPEEGKGVNTFLKILFALPIPIIFARIGLRLGKRFVDEPNVDFSEISQLLKYSRNTRVDIDTDDAQVNIRII